MRSLSYRIRQPVKVTLSTKLVGATEQGDNGATEQGAIELLSIYNLHRAFRVTQNTLHTYAPLGSLDPLYSLYSLYNPSLLSPHSLPSQG